MNSGTDIEAMDDARRVLNAVKRMRRQAARSARRELIEHVDQMMAEEERLVGRAIENLLRSNMGLVQA